MKKIVAFVLFTMMSIGLNAKGGNFEAKRDVLPGGYNFWVYTPDDYDAQGLPLPLIIFLHGASLCGNNLDRVLRYGTLDAIEKGKIIPALVVAPQNPGGAWNPDKINDMLQWMEAHYRVDASRIYVLGMSLGGYGTLDFAGTYPDKIAAAMALCGGCTLKNQQNLGRVPLWIIHGTADKAVGVNESKAVVQGLHKAGNDKLLRYDWVKGGSHGLLARLFYMQKTYDWLFAHSLKDKPRSIDRSFEIDREDIARTYQELKFQPDMYEND